MIFFSLEKIFFFRKKIKTLNLGTWPTVAGATISVQKKDILFTNDFFFVFYTWPTVGGATISVEKKDTLFTNDFFFVFYTWPTV